jgi:hypothetical protein
MLFIKWYETERTMHDILISFNSTIIGHLLDKKQSMTIFLSGSSFNSLYESISIEWIRFTRSFILINWRISFVSRYLNWIRTVRVRVRNVMINSIQKLAEKNLSTSYIDMAHWMSLLHWNGMVILFDCRFTGRFLRWNINFDCIVYDNDVTRRMPIDAIDRFNRTATNPIVARVGMYAY